MRLTRFLITLFSLLCGSVFGQHDVVQLIENKGQWPAQVVAQTPIQNGQFFLEKNAFTYDFFDEATMALRSKAHVGLIDGRNLPAKIRCHAVRVSFEGASKESKIVKSQRGPTLFNYLKGNDPAHWVHGARAYGDFHYQDLYPGIDLKFYSIDGTLKYDLIVKSTGDAGNIVLNYQGASSVGTKNGNLLIKTSINDWQEMKPYAYQVYGDQKQEVACKYVVKGGKVTFEIGDYNKAKPLVIDPILMVSTYSGAIADNFGYTATYDSKGFLYSGSSVLGPQGYPTTTGAYDTDFNGGSSDFAITKYDTTGTFRIYSTLLGGTGSELPHSLIVDSKDQLVIYGTTSSLDFPVTANAPQPNFRGGTPVSLVQGLGVNYANGTDIFVSKLNFDGTGLIGSTYLGGSGNDGINIGAAGAAAGLKYNYADEIRGEVLLDDLDNLYIATMTMSSDLALPDPNVFQTTRKGNLEGVIFKLDFSLTQHLWTSYLGGSGDDAVLAIDINRDGFVIVSGGTISSDLPTDTSSFQPTFGGGRADGFLASISPDGHKLRNITYWGGTGYDQIFLHEFGPDNNVYVFGQTETSGAKFNFNHTGFKQNNSGQFITKFSETLDSAIYSLTFGNSIARPQISPTAFLVDNCGNIYCAGWGGRINQSNANLGVSNNAQQCNGFTVTSESDPRFRSTSDNDDFFIMKLSPDAASQLNGFYFGENGGLDHVDGGTSRFDKRSQVYHSVCASCGGGQGFPTTPNAASTTNNSPGGCNNAAFKMDFESQAVSADFSWTPASCEDDTIEFYNTSFQGLTYKWDFGDGSAQSFQENPVHVYPTPGVYDVKLIAINPGTCNQNDTLTKRVVIYPIGKHQKPDSLICLSDTLQLGFDTYPAASYDWSPGTGLSDSTIADPFFYPDTVQQYVLVMNAYGCVDTTIIKTTVDGVVASFMASKLTCGLDTVHFINNSVSADRYLWNFGDGTVSTTENPSHAFPGPGVYKVSLYSTTFDPGPVCYPVDSMVRTITIYPTGTHNLPDTLICRSDTVQLNFPHYPGAKYKWTPSVGLSSDTAENPLIYPNSSNQYRRIMTAGPCSDTTFVRILTDGVLAFFTNTSACEGDSTTFINRSINGNTYIWDFGDGSNLNGQTNPKYKYNNPGTYYVTLVATNGNSGNCPASDTTTIEVHVYPRGSIQLPDTAVCRGDTIQIGYEPIPGAKYKWTPPNGLSSDTVSNPTLIPDGTVNYTLVIKGANCTDSTKLKIVPQGVGARFTFNGGGCEDQPVDFFNGSFDATSYRWDFGDGSPVSVVTNPSHTYSSPGVYTVKLIAYTNNPGTLCPASDTIIKEVRVFPKGNRQPPDQTFCRQDSVQIGYKPIPGSSYQWIPSTGLSNDTISNPTLQPGGNTTKYILISKAGSCVDTLTVNIFAQGVKADFDYTTGLCQNDSIRFNNYSIGATSYVWDFGDGQTSTLKDLRHLYDSAGTYTVRLIANGGGTVLCPGKDTVYAVLNIYPSGFHPRPDTLVCRNDSLYPNIIEYPGATYSWTPGYGVSDSTIANPLLFSDTITSFTVLTSYGGCIDSTKINLTLDGVKAAFDLTELSCIQDTVFFTNNSSAADRSAWYFGDGNASDEDNPYHVYTQPGVYEVKLFSTKLDVGKYCQPTDSAVQTIIVYPHGNQVLPDTSMCRSDSIQIGFDPIFGAKYQWSPSAGLSNDTIANPWAAPGSNTSYTLIISGGLCSDTTHVQINTSGVKADFIYGNTTCEDMNIVFTNQSENGLTYKWEFGDGGTDNTFNTSHTYANPGVYTVNLITTVSTPNPQCPAVDTASKELVIYPVGIHSLPDQIICRGDSVQLGGAAYPGANYKWTPPNGLSSDTVSNPMLLPDSTETYTLVISAGTCKDSTIVKLIVRGIESKFSFTGGTCTNDTIQFTNESSNASTYLWNFGDGSPGTTSTNTSHSYAQAGTYRVVLYAYNAIPGAPCPPADSSFFDVVVNHSGKRTLPPVNVCRGDTMKIGYKPVPGERYQWYPSDGLSDDTISNPILYPDATVEKYTLISTSNGCGDTSYYTFNSDGVRADFEFGLGLCQNDSMWFTNLSSGAFSYAWDFGDGTQSTDTNVRHLFTQPGLYPVRLIASGVGVNCPAKDTIIIPVYIYPQGNHQLPDTVICRADSISIGVDEYPGAKYSWSPGINVTDSTIANPILLPDSSMTFTLITRYGGCFDTSTVDVAVGGAKADFILTKPGCLQDTVFFTNTSVAGKTFIWDYGDGTTSQDTNTYHIYTKPGLYIVKLVAFGPVIPGCSEPDSMIQAIPVYPNGRRSLGDTLFCKFDTLNYVNDSLPGATYTWSTAFNLSDSTVANPEIYITQDTSYILYTDFGSCHDTATLNIKVLYLKLIPSQSDTLICSGPIFKLVADGQGTIETFTWSDQADFSNQINGGPQDSAVVVVPVTLTTYYIKGNTGYCELNDSVRLVVLDGDTTTLPDRLICRGDSIQIGLNTNVDPGETYTWTPSTYLDNPNVPNPKSGVPDSIEYKLYATIGGCFEYFKQKVRTRFIDMLAFTDSALCDPNKNILLTADGKGQVVQYIWSDQPNYSNVLNPTGDSTILVHPPGPQTYFVQGISNGCVYEDSVVILADYINLGLASTQSFCNKTPFILDAMSTAALSYEWYPKNYILGPGNTQQIQVLPPGPATFYVLATNNDGCQITDSVAVAPTPFSFTTIDVDASDTLMYKDRPVTVTATPNNPTYTYSWSPPQYFADPTAATTTVYATDSIQITLTISDGVCPQSIPLFLRYKEVICGPPNVFVPNAFTPNQDSENDLLRVRGNHIEKLTFVIYDRWGEKMFETDDQNYGWDGNFKGKPLDPAVFVYYLQMTCKDRQQYFEKGNITLIR